jgi:hypothetical protein
MSASAASVCAILGRIPVTVIVAAEVNNRRRLIFGRMAMTLLIDTWRAGVRYVCPKSATSPRGNHLVADDRLVEDASPHLDAQSKME